MFNEKKFPYSPKNNPEIAWNISYDISNDKYYRNFVLLKQISPQVKMKKTVTLVMLNQGSFHNEESLKRDKTLEYLRKAFFNSGYIIEILNLFNRCEPKKKNLALMNESDRNRNNMIEERLRTYNKGDKVIIQWGKLNKEAFVKRAEKIQEVIEEIGLINIGFKEESGCYFPHPMRWNFINGHKRFKDEVISRI